MIQEIATVVISDHLSDQALIDQISESQGIELERLQTLFYRRYGGYVFKTATLACGSFPDKHDMANDIVQETFLIAIKRIGKFNLSKEPDPARHPLMIKAWLGKIANTQFLKALEKQPDHVPLNYEVVDTTEASFDMFESLFGDEVPAISNEFRTRLQEALKFIKQEHIHILLVYANEGCIGSNEKLSRNAMNELCKKYNTTSANIRQIKKRTLDKIKAMCVIQTE